MNIFVVSRDPVKAAQMLCDSHVVAMARESTQMVSTVARLSGIEIGLRITHQNHPCVKWAQRSSANFQWLLAHGKALCAEYTYRYLGRHSCKTELEAVETCAWLIHFKESKLTPFVQVVPEQYRCANAVTAYRNFYKGEKARFAKWRGPRPAPPWW